jgi:hypothetical protein
VDPRTFDGKIRQLSRALSRRSLVGGSIGATLLATAGFADDTRAKKIKVEKCLPPGQRCGTKKNDEPCRKCCHRYFITTPKGTKKCACRPDGIECSNPSQCCTGACQSGRCGATAVAPAAACRPAGTGCTSPTQCCTGICENGLCGPAICNNVNAGCDRPEDCCSGVCGCVDELFPIIACTCRKAGCAGPNEPCEFNSDCCTEFCYEGSCDEP